MRKTPEVSFLFKQRRAGLLLHPTSLPSGTLGADAYRLVDFMAEAGLSVWQMLPIGPTHSDLSPYQSLSAHAGNPRLIDTDWLVHQGWLGEEDIAGKSRAAILSLAAEKLPGQGGEDYQAFCEEQAAWLDDVVLFQTLREIQGGKPWNQWPEEFRQRQPKALAGLRKTHASRLAYHRFEQFLFYCQWRQLRDYARDKGVYLFGDIPIFVAHDSADVWANQRFFRLDGLGNPLTVAGVPPDYFSETGQHWGNPHYDWDAMEADGFNWWVARIASQLQMFDLIRIDHFRGFEAFWEIPGQDKDARNGRWVKAPGRALLRKCFDTFHELPLVAENLGLITDEVEALRHEFNLPGMLVLQFAFDGNPRNPHLPHNHLPLDVIYTGTHDNDTSLGWYDSLNEHDLDYVRHYLGPTTETMPWALIRTALVSTGRMALIPMQDFLGLDGQHRMNMPGTTANNWVWRFDWNQLPTGLAGNIRQLLQVYDRL